MKTITGKIISSTPVSLSKAAKIISNFADSENGASQAISAYIRRASASFNELKQLHREIEKSSKSERKHKRPKSEDSDFRNEGSRETVEGGEKRIRNELTKELGEERKHEREKENSDGKIANFEEQRRDGDEGGKKAERKRKRKNEEILDGKGSNSSEQQNKKKKKKGKGEGGN